MTTEKERQHYVPKFYLRNFSFEGNLKQIGLFNLNTNFFYQKAKLKTQCYKSFFYGKDGKIEESLSELEADFAPLLKKISDTDDLPPQNSEQHELLLLFLLITEVRNPIASKFALESQAHLEQRLNEMELARGADTITEIPKMTSEEAINIVFSSIKTSLQVCQDLGYKLIINNSELPFVTSDNPVIKYNQYLEGKKAVRGLTGLASVGIQILIPINPRKLILFYDKQVYKVGDKKKNYVEIKSAKDIEQLNILQILNCDSNIFFNHEVTKQYVEALKAKSQQYSKPNIPQSTILDKFDANGNVIDDRSLIYMSTSHIAINLCISNITLTKRIKAAEFDKTRPSVRPKAMSIMEKYSR